MKKYILALILALSVSACSMQSPFIDKSPEMQVAGATVSSDPDRTLGMSFITIKALRKGTKKDYLMGLAAALDTAAKGSVTNIAASEVIKTYIKEHAKYPEDAMVANYVVAKMGIGAVDVKLETPLTPEQKRVLGVYSQAIKDTVESFKE